MSHLRLCSTTGFLIATIVAMASCTVGAPGGTGPGGGPSFDGDGGPGSGTDGGNTNHTDGGSETVPDSGNVAPLMCSPTSCMGVGANCGPIGDGCGGTLQCGTCAVGESCGGGGTGSQCGSGMTCMPRTCRTAGANCGPVADGCGGILQCGICGTGSTCGGDGTPSVCSGTSATCTGLCQQQVMCPQSGKTTITGTVRAPTPSTFGTADPLYGAVVYIPNGTVADFAPGVACETCGATVSGDPLVSTSSGPDGTFTLSDAPVGANIPLVIQIGRWRRRLTIPMVSACVNNALTPDQTRLPRNKSEGDIPLTAMVTGSADPLECVLRKIGIDDAEFTDPSGTGRVHMYVDNGTKLDSSTPSESTLTGSEATLKQYDMVIFACAGQEECQSPADVTNVVNYANAGGRVFATHFSYVWFDANTGGNNPWNGTATWSHSGCPSGGGGGGGNNSVTATVDQSFTDGMAFASWLKTVGASTTLGSVPIAQVRNDFTGVTAPAQRWLYDSSQPLHYTFNTPVDAMQGGQCGKALFSDFHVNSGGGGGGGCTSSSQCSGGGICVAGFCIGGGGGGGNFPGECDTTPMTPQEKALEFMIFDLASCVPGGGFVIGGGGGL